MKARCNSNISECHLSIVTDRSFRGCMRQDRAERQEKVLEKCLSRGTVYALMPGVQVTSCKLPATIKTEP